MSYKTRLPKKAEKALFDLMQLEVISKKESFKFALRYLARKQKNGQANNHTSVYKRQVYETTKIDRGIDLALASLPTAECGQIVKTIKSQDTAHYDVTQSKVYHRLQLKVDKGLVDKVKVDGSSKVLYAKRHIPINRK